MLNSYEVDVLQYKKLWPGMSLNAISEKDWFNKRQDIDDMLKEETHQVDGATGFSSIHIHKQIYFFEK